jgi:hypothetical protein
MAASRFLAPALLAVASLAASAELRVTTPAELRAAIAAAQPGDVVVLAPGRYDVVGNVNCVRAGLPGAPITVRAECPLAAHVRFDAVEGFHVQAAHWTFEGLDIEGACADDSQCEHAFHVTGDADFFTLRGCDIRDFNAQVKANGVDPGTGRLFPDDALIENCELHDTRARQTSNPVTKIDVVGGRRWIVRRNFIHDYQKGQGDTISYAAFLKGNSRDGLFLGNTVLGARDFAGGIRLGLSFGGGGSSPDPICEGGTCTPEHQDGLMIDNFIAGCNDVGIYLNEAARCFIHHNTLHDTAGIDVRFVASTCDLRNNLMTGRIRARDGGTFTAACNQELVPLATFQQWFAAPALGDFTLLDPAAAFLDACSPLVEVPADACGDPRDDGAADRGAGEYALRPPCPKTPPRPPAGGATLTGPGASLRLRKAGADAMLAWAPASDPAWRLYRDGDVSAVGGLPPSSAWRSPGLPAEVDAGALFDGAFHAYVVRATEPCTGAEAE